MEINRHFYKVEKSNNMHMTESIALEITDRFKPNKKIIICKKDTIYQDNSFWITIDSISENNNVIMLIYKGEKKNLFTLYYTKKIFNLENISSTYQSQIYEKRFNHFENRIVSINNNQADSTLQKNNQVNGINGDPNINNDNLLQHLQQNDEYNKLLHPDNEIANCQTTVNSVDETEKQNAESSTLITYGQEFK
jgi:hypothetical protein